MPGIDLNLDLPTLSDPLADAIAKISTALSLIEDDLADPVTSGEININAELSANGQPITNVGGLRLAGGESTVVGTLYEKEGDLWMTSGDGTVRITAAGNINAAGIGGFGGDYGTGDELASYDTASHQFRFKQNVSDWADLAAGHVFLSNGTGSVEIKVDAAITTGRVFSFKTLPGSGVSALVYDASTSTLETADTKRATNDVKVTTLDASTSLTVPTLSGLKHGESEIVQGYDNDIFGGSVSGAITGNYFNATISSGASTVRIKGLHVGQRIKRITVWGGSTIDPGLAVFRQGPGGTTTGVTVTSAFTFPVDGRRELTVTSPVAIASGETWWVKITPNASTVYNAIAVVIDTV